MRIEPAKIGPVQDELRATLPRPLKSGVVEYISETVVFSQCVRSILWCTVLLIIASNAAVLALFALVYAQNEQNDSLLWLVRIYLLYYDANSFLLRNSTGIAASYGALSFIFGYIAIRMVANVVPWNTILMRSKIDTLAKSSSLGTNTRPRSPIRSSVVCCPVLLQHQTARARAAITRVHATVRRVQAVVTRIRSAIGVRGPYFELRLLVEEWFELGTQTVAAYSASRSISNAPLNVTFAVVIFTNSVSSVFYAYAFPRSLLKQRLACVFTDLALDFVWGTLLPMWMYTPLVQLYLHRSTLIDNLASFSGLTREAERILHVSWRTFALGVIPFLFSLLKLLDVQRILQDIIPRARQEPGGHEGVRAPLVVGRVKPGRVPRVLHALMPVYGLAVLLTSLAANEAFRSTHKQMNVGCTYRVHPWFSADEACIRRELNCSKLEIAGRSEELAPILNWFDSSSLSDIFFADCPALEMPSKIHRFRRLLTIGITNSTIVSWGAEAELRDTIFASLRLVMIFDVVFIADPVGLTGLNGPVASSLEWIHLENVDGNRILPLVGYHWRRLLNFDCMGCGLTVFPSIMYGLPRLIAVSLAFNDFASIPDDWATGLQLPLQMFWVDVNFNLTELPDSLWRQVPTCTLFSVSYTNFSTIPDWVADIVSPGFQIHAAGSPLCTGLMTLPMRTREIVACTEY